MFLMSVQSMSGAAPGSGRPSPAKPPAVANLSGMATEVLPPADDAGQPAPHTTAGKLADLEKRRSEAAHAGSQRAVERQHARGKMTARERIDGLLDPGSFTEFDELARHRATDFGMTANRPYGDGVVTGYGTIDGRPVCVFSQDFTVFGGSLGEVYGEKIVKVMDHALKTGCPVIGINDGGGARIQEGVVALGLFAEIFYRNVMASGVVPQISLIMGPCAGGAVYSPAITDFTLMVEGTSHMFITGPDVIKDVTGEDVTLDELGGADNQARYGNIHQVVEDEAAAFQYVRDYLSFLPANTFDDPPIVNPGLEPELTASDLELDSIVPDADNTAYDMHEILLRIFDDGEVFDVGAQRGLAMITAFARVDGRPVGVIANQPLYLAGSIDNEASDKAAGFVRFCDSYNLPLVFVVDTPGALPGVEQEKGGIIKRGGRYFNAVVEADVPKVTITIRKSYGGGYAVMGSKQLTADLNFAWPTARIAVIGAEGAAQLLMKRFPDPNAPEAQEIKRQFIDGYNLNMAIPWIAAERGYIDGVIQPHETRLLLRKSLHLLRDKQIRRVQRKHGLTPI